MIEITKIKKIIIANWKMHGSQEFAKDYANKLDFYQSDINKSLVVCPPLTLIPYLKSSKFYLGAQDCSSFDNGAYTGEISSNLLEEMGCKFCIVGHSERRNFFYEDAKTILNKINNLEKNNIIPIICIGENLNQRKENLTKDVLKDLIIKSLPQKFNIKKIIIAYEPLWSIGSGLVPSLEEISEIHYFIKKNIFDDIDVKVIYGGSVKAVNYKKILEIESVDGLLVGGASINLDEFNQIIKF